MLRLFIGFFLPTPITQHLESVATSLLLYPGFRVLPAEMWHLTVQFLGEVEDKNRALIQSVLGDALASHSGLTLSLVSGGAFPKKGPPSVFWAGVQGDLVPLQEMKKNIEQALGSVNLAGDDRDFHPHVTLARWDKNQASHPGVRQQFDRLIGNYRSPLFQVSAIQLIQSHLHPSGPVYTTVAHFPLRPH